MSYVARIQMRPPAPAPGWAVTDTAAAGSPATALHRDGAQPSSTVTGGRTRDGSSVVFVAAAARPSPPTSSAQYRHASAAFKFAGEVVSLLDAAPSRSTAAARWVALRLVRVAVRARVVPRTALLSEDRFRVDGATG